VSKPAVGVSPGAAAGGFPLEHVALLDGR